MDCRASDYLKDINPRKSVRWRCSGPVKKARQEWIESDNVSHWYVIGDYEDFRGHITISDFTALIGLIEIGEQFKSLSIQDLQQEKEFLQRNPEGCSVVLRFVERFGFPYLAEELQRMPQSESERLRKLHSEEFMNETGAWYPKDGCAMMEIVCAAYTLYQLWTLWSKLQNLSENATEERKSLIGKLNNAISRGGWVYQYCGFNMIHAPSLTHTIYYNEVNGSYHEIYETRNLFRIAFDQLYSFFVDYEGGKYNRIKNCARCSHPFIPSNRQKYCPECQSSSNTARSRKFREANPEKDMRNRLKYSIKRKYKLVLDGKMTEDEFSVWEKSYLNSKGLADNVILNEKP